MSDLELLITGAMVTFIALSGAYVAIRHRANEDPVDSYKSAATNRHGLEPEAPAVMVPAVASDRHGRPN